MEARVNGLSSLLWLLFSYRVSSLGIYAFRVRLHLKECPRLRRSLLGVWRWRTSRRWRRKRGAEACPPGRGFGMKPFG